MGKLIIE